MKKMKKIKKFEQYNTNESLAVAAGGGLILLAAYGALWGYSKVENLFNFIKYQKALYQISPIFDKIKGDSKIIKLLKDLFEYKDGLYFGEEEGENPRRTKAFKIRNEIYDRASEILNEEEFNTFKSAATEFERGSEKPAGYFTDKDSKFQGWEYTA